MNKTSTSPQAKENAAELAVCPVCRQTADLFLKLPASTLYNCPRCHHRFLLLSVDDSEQALKELYQEHYGGFRSDPVFQTVVREELAKNFVPRVPPPARLLDVGCGNGDFLSLAQESGYQVKGVDISEAAAELCRGRGLEAQSGDFLSMPLEDDFDLVTMWDVVEHLPDPQAFFQRAFEILKPGGYLVIKTPYAGVPRFAAVKAIPRLAGVLLHVPTHIQWFSNDTLEKALRNNGFTQFDWLKDRPMRSLQRTRNVRKALVRQIPRLLDITGQSGNLFVIARKPQD